MVATEQSSVREILESKVKEKPGFIIVGEAESAIKAMSLARTLRPDVAIIDSALPHNFGIDSLPLSRIGGLDTAQAISEEMPDTRVILLTNTDTWTVPNKTVELDIEEVLKGNFGGGETLVAEPARPEPTPAPVSFTKAVTIDVPSDIGKQNLADSSLFIGMLLSLLGGLFIVTMLLAPAGFIMLGLGIAVSAFGAICGMFRRRADSREDFSAGTEEDER